MRRQACTSSANRSTPHPQADHARHPRPLRPATAALRTTLVARSLLAMLLLRTTPQVAQSTGTSLERLSSVRLLKRHVRVSSDSWRAQGGMGGSRLGQQAHTEGPGHVLAAAASIEP